jgi:hypothetical protein
MQRDCPRCGDLVHYFVGGGVVDGNPSALHARKETAVSQGPTLAHFRAQLEDLREHIAHVRAQLEHVLATSTGYLAYLGDKVGSR